MNFTCSKCGLGAGCIPTGINGFRVCLPDRFAVLCPDIKARLDEAGPRNGVELDCEHMNRSGDLAFDQWLRRNGYA